MAEMFEDASYEAPEETEDSTDGGEKPTAILPKTFFEGKEIKVGGKCTIRVVSEQEDSVLVEYVKSEGDDEEEEVEEEGEVMEEMPASPMSEMMA